MERRAKEGRGGGVGNECIRFRLEGELRERKKKKREEGIGEGRGNTDKVKPEI